MNSLKFTVNLSSVFRSLPCTFHWGSPEYPSLQRSSTHIDPSVPSFFSYAPSDWFIHLIGRVRQNVPLCNYIENVLYQNQCRKVVWYHFVWILAHQHIQHLAEFFSSFQIFEIRNDQMSRDWGFKIWNQALLDILVFSNRWYFQPNRDHLPIQGDIGIHSCLDYLYILTNQRMSDFARGIHLYYCRLFCAQVYIQCSQNNSP